MVNTLGAGLFSYILGSLMGRYINLEILNNNFARAKLVVDEIIKKGIYVKKKETEFKITRNKIKSYIAILDKKS